jgi:lysophospholipase L1-like esterase
MCSLREPVLSLTAAMLLFSGCGYKIAATPFSPPPTSTTSTAPTPTTPTPSVIFIGDSITDLWATGPGKAYFSTHPTWISKGVSGQTSGQVLARFQTDVVDLHPAVVHILVGTNDVYPGWVLGSSDANVTAMVEIAQGSAIKVVLATIPPWETDPLTDDVANSADPSPSRYQRIKVWNDWLRQFALANCLPLADYHKILEASNHQNYLMALTLDGVHPSSQGFTVITPVAERAIESALNNAISMTACWINRGARRTCD